MEDDDFEDFENRENILGFTPVKEIVFNHLLPYSEELDSESTEWFSEIRSQFERIIRHPDFKIGYPLWINGFYKYLSLYGYKFSKSDHIAFIKSLLLVLQIEYLDYQLLNISLKLLNFLLKKKKYLLPTELTIEWKPLYELYEKLFFSNYEQIGLLRYPPTLESNCRTLIKHCRCYFPQGSTAEIWEEFRPLLCPFVVSMNKACNYLELFLPTYNLRSEYSYDLWFSKLIVYLEAFVNPVSWESHLFSLFSRLAQHSIGQIDWNPYLPLFFARFQRSFHLPVHYKKMEIGKYERTTDNRSIAKFIVSSLGKGSQTQEHLTQLFRVLESYYQCVNAGAHSKKLLDFLLKLSTAFVKRLHDEKVTVKSSRSGTPNLSFTLNKEREVLESKEIEDFITSLLPSVLHSVYSTSSQCSQILCILSSISPSLLLPPLLSRLSSDLESLHEPHKIRASMAAVLSVARSLISPESNFEEGKSEIIPLLIASLSGIDGNDVLKTLVSFNFISTFCSLIPIVDSSSFVSDSLSNLEKTLVAQTGQFEDFVLEFLEKIFGLIDSSGLEDTRSEFIYSEQSSSQEENVKVIGLVSAFNAILNQCSTKLYDVVLRKLTSYISGRVLEFQIAGKLAGSLIRIAVKVHPSKGLKAFLPNALRNCNYLLEENEGVIDHEIKFNLLIISEAVSFAGAEALPYKEDLEALLEKTLHLSDKEAFTLAGLILRNLLRSLVSIYTLEQRSLPFDFDKSPSEHCYIRDWGRSGNIKEMSLTWHLPNEEEKSFAQSLTDRFLGSEVKTLKQYLSGSSSLTRTQLKISLSILENTLLGAGVAFPLWWSETPFFPDESSPIIPIISSVNLRRGNLPDISFENQNIRRTLVSLLNNLSLKLIQESEDDVTNTLSLIRLFGLLIFFGGLSLQELKRKKKAHFLLKKSLESKLLGISFRSLLIERIELQHETRLLESMSLILLTQTHVLVLQRLFDLSSSSPYSLVRYAAGDVLSQITSTFPTSYKIIIPSLISCLQRKTPIETKGSLHIILSHYSVQCDWSSLLVLWPAILRAIHVERPSFVSLLVSMTDSLSRTYVTPSIDTLISESMIMEINKFFEFSFLSSNDSSRISIKSSEKTQEYQTRNDESKSYESLVLSLTQILREEKEEKLHWRHYILASTMLNLLARPDKKFPSSSVSLALSNLTHDNSQVRSLSLSLLTKILKQYKRKRSKRPLDSSLTLDRESQVLGHRPDNEWMCYDSQRRPLNESDWEESPYLHKSHFGFTSWPSVLYIYEPISEESLPVYTETEQLILSYFSNSILVEKYFEVLSLEETDRDIYGGHGNNSPRRFDVKRFLFFKGLFRNFGDVFNDVFQPFVEALAVSEEESRQRLASELIASLIRGAKHWSFAMTEKLMTWIVPLIRRALDKISNDSVGHWGTCFSTASESRDPHRIYWILETLMENPLRSKGSFNDAARLYVLQGALAHQEWRVYSLQFRLLQFLTPSLNHSYQNVRERLGSVLTSIHLYDIDIRGGNNKCPKSSSLIRQVLPMLQELTFEIDSRVEESEDSKKQLGHIRLLQTICKFVSGVLRRGWAGPKKEFYDLLPILTIHESNEFDVNLARDCSYTLAILSASLTNSEIFPVCLRSILSVTKSHSWKAKTAILEFLQTLIFHNIHFLLFDKESKRSIQELIEETLRDESIEVCRKSSQVLSGLLHIQFLDPSTADALLKSFYGYLVESKTKSSSSVRHIGILGLCAFVNSHPYDVPKTLPKILMTLTTYLNDSPPIPATIKTTLQNFRRTHQDDWENHKLKFSEDELIALTEILVSPSYYA